MESSPASREAATGAGPISSATSPRNGSSQLSGQLQAQSPSSAGPAIQLKGRGRGGGRSAAGVHARAAEGVSGSGGKLPHQDPIQESFGKHDISSVKAHVGGKAGAAAQDIGAQAYATGNDIAFQAGPDLHTAAHEAAHVVQQRSGVQLKGGVGRAGDGYENNADAVADAVVQRKSAEPLLDKFAGPSTAGAGVQMRELPKKQVSAQAMTRLGHARKGIAHTKKVLKHGGGNQREALEATKFNSYFRMAAMRDPECWHIDPAIIPMARKYPEALVAAKADLAQGGNCGEHAMVAFDFLRMTASSEQVNRVSVKGLDHAFVLIGSIKKDDDAEITACDPWPTRPTACLWEDHFAHADKSEINIANSISGDDADVKAVIASGLSLSAKGQAYVKHAYDEEKTRTAIEEGTKRESPSEQNPEGSKPWIWDHENAARTEYEYEGPEVAAPEPAAPEPVSGGQQEEAEQQDRGFWGFIKWIRSFF